MTTEVLRNMLYAGSGALERLGYVVMDEVHYLADRFRGAVWEEVIIHLPERGAAGLAVGDGQQRRGVRRVAGRGARRHHGGRATSTGRCRCGSTCWSARRMFDLFADGPTDSDGPTRRSTVDPQLLRSVRRGGLGATLEPRADRPRRAGAEPRLAADRPGPT